MAALFLYNSFNTVVSIPFFKEWQFDLIYYIIFAVFMSAPNAVNLTDGLTALAIAR